MKTSVIVASVLAMLFISCKDSSPERTQKTPVVSEPVEVMPPVVPPVTPSPPSALDDLPKDTGGSHQPHVLGSDTAPYGYYLYTPSGYTASGPRFPLLIFLIGAGEIGNSSNDPNALNKIFVHGPPLFISKGLWGPRYPMVVASVQCHDGWWDIDKVKKFTEFMMNTYQVDTTPIYMTGLSMGGNGTWDQIARFGKASHVTAAVPIGGSGVMYDANTVNASYIPVWAFHGANDPTATPDYDIAMWKGINALHPNVAAKLTMYPATGHDVWTRTYNGTGMGTEDKSYDPFDMDIYSWMLQYQK